ncbi:MAG: hypothetical protein ABI199_00680 [Bacteroidia bacterium]
MNFKDVLELLSIFWLCTVKFSVAGVPAAVFAGLPFFEAVTITSLGGFAGILIFTFLSESILRWWKKKITRYALVIPRKPRKIHSFRNKFLVKFKRNFGLAGIAAITPIFLSIPLGAFIAVRYYSNKQQILAYMFVSVFLWAVVLFFFYGLFYNHIHVFALPKKL